MPMAARILSFISTSRFIDPCQMSTSTVVGSDPPATAQIAAPGPGNNSTQYMQPWNLDNVQPEIVPQVVHDSHQSTLFDDQYQDLIDPNMTPDISGHQRGSSDTADNDHDGPEQ
jgi:hypothetical protein